MKHQIRTTSALTLSAALFLASLPAVAAPAGAGGQKVVVVNINSAEAAQIALLPRIGLSVAQRVVDYRKKNGPFKTTDDLMLVQGVGEKTYQLIKPYVTTTGDTTLQEKVRSSRSKQAKGAKSDKSGKTAKSGKSAKGAKEATR